MKFLKRLNRYSRKVEVTGLRFADSLQSDMRKRVLLIDDQLLDVVLTRQALHDCTVEHEIVATADGLEGLIQLRSQKFDVVILDLKMPKTDGFEVLEQLRQQPGLRNMPVIVLSNSNLWIDRVRAANLGVVEYIHKSMEYPEFKNNLRAALRQHGFC